MKPARFATIALALVMLGAVTMFIAGMALTSAIAYATSYGA